jgi:hypothetical protein
VGDVSAALERIVARKDEEHWRALCERLEIDYDGVAAAPAG